MLGHQILRGTILGLLAGLFLVGNADARMMIEFSADVTEGVVPLAVSFQNESTHPRVGVVSYHWDFGDGTTSTDRDPVHLYTAVGSYDVTLTMTHFEVSKSVVLEDLVEVHDVLMFEDFEDSTIFGDQWDETVGPVAWTDSPALLGSGSMAVELTFNHDSLNRMNNDDGLIVAGGGSGTGCPIPNTPCRDWVDYEAYGTFSFHFDLGQLDIQNGADFSVFQLFEEDLEGQSLVKAVIRKTSNQYWMEFVVGQASGPITTTPISLQANGAQKVQMIWIAGRATNGTFGQFHAAVNPTFVHVSNDAMRTVSLLNLDNFDQGFDFWKIGLFDGFLPGESAGNLILDQFEAHRGVTSAFENVIQGGG